jgi:hypothetical protein
MDAGSGINLIYAKTLRAMHISPEYLKPTDCSFHGIVPGSANYPLGRIALDICFSNRQNYRREKLDFEVMDGPSQYHAILGRPAFSQFLAVPHYTYLVLKMPSKGNHHSEGELRTLRSMRQGIPQDGAKVGMIANYGQSKDKITSMTTGTTKQPEEHPAEPEEKKLRVQPSDPKEATTEGKETSTT